MTSQRPPKRSSGVRNGNPGAVAAVEGLGVGVLAGVGTAGRSIVAPQISPAASSTIRVINNGKRDFGGANSSIFTDRIAGAPSGAACGAAGRESPATQGRPPPDSGTGAQPGCGAELGGAEPSGGSPRGRCGGCWLIAAKATRCRCAGLWTNGGPNPNLCGRLSEPGATCRQCQDVSISEPQPRLAVRNIEDLVGLVPYLIGFHPEQSLVVIVIEAGRVAVTARVDLAAVAASPTDLVHRLFERYPDAGGWFIAYTDDDDLAWQVLGACAALEWVARPQRLLQVGSLSWRADASDGPTGAITGEVASVAAEAALLGLPARPSRKDLAASLAGPPEAETDDLVAGFRDVTADLDRMGARGRRRLLRRLLAAADPPGVRDCLRLALLVEQPEGQVRVLRQLCRETAEQQLALWTRVIRHSLADHQPAVLGLLGMAAWQNGDGALQMVCLERLDRLDPLVPLAAMLDWLNAEVVPPQDWEHLRELLLAALADQFTVTGRRSSPPGR